mgnify:FL=1
MFTGGKSKDKTHPIGEVLTDLNHDAFADDRVSVVIGDAFVEVERLVASGRYFDTIIVDLPDPSHPDLNKLYSTYFYSQLSHLLSADGVLVSQSTSPYHSKETFISIGKTLKAAGFERVEQYHANVPSFGEWGWSLAMKVDTPMSVRLERTPHQWEGFSQWLTKGLLMSSFQFSKDFFKEERPININELGSHQIYQYHQDSWVGREGLLSEPTN